MRKTVRQWIEDLPEPYKTQAFENNEKVRHLKVDDSPIWGCLYEKCNSKLAALMIAFPWSKSNEGIRYWIDFIDNLKEK